MLHLELYIPERCLGNDQPSSEQFPKLLEEVALVRGVQVQNHPLVTRRQLEGHNLAMLEALRDNLILHENTDHGDHGSGEHLTLL
jgi:hypothetical protein